MTAEAVIQDGRGLPLPEEAVGESEAVSPTAAQPSSALESREGPSLASKIIRGSLVVMTGNVASQGIRFLSNIILAWLLTPDDFGTMAIVTVFLIGLQMFSDIGIGMNIIQSKREDDAFIHTAWTTQVIRGICLWLVSCLIAWPVSKVWYPELFWLLPVAGLTALIRGFLASRRHTLNRKLSLVPLTATELGKQIVGVIATICYALFVDASVWAFVAGALTAAVFEVTMTHTVMPGRRDRFCFDREAFGELFTFGRWLFLSSIITFLSAQTTPLVYGALFTASMMGVFWIGRQLSDMLPRVMMLIGQQVGFAGLSEAYRRAPENFEKNLKKMRFWLLVPITGCLCGLILLAQPFFYYFYKPGYQGAGWVAQVLAVNSLGLMLNTSYGHAYMAMGRTKYNLLTVLSTFLVELPISLVGYYVAGEFGFVTALAATQFLKYPCDAYLSSRLGIWQPRIDMLVMIGGALACTAALWASVLWMNWIAG